MGQSWPIPGQIWPMSAEAACVNCGPTSADFDRFQPYFDQIRSLCDLCLTWPDWGKLLLHPGNLCGPCSGTLLGQHNVPGLSGGDGREKGSRPFRRNPSWTHTRATLLSLLISRLVPACHAWNSWVCRGLR